MDHSPSIITQVARDEEDNATCGEEGEFGPSLENFQLRMTVSVRDIGVTTILGVRNVTGWVPSDLNG